MKIDPNSSFWINNSYEEVKNMLELYEKHLMDEYVECQIHINAHDPDIVGAQGNLQWWIGNKDRILMEIWYVKVAYGVTFDKVIAASNSLPKYEDMSEYCQKVWRRLNE